MTDHEETSMPHNAEVEQALLGSLLTSGRGVEDVYDILSPGHFYFPTHQEIYGKIISLYESSREIDTYVIIDDFKKSGDLESIGGPGYISDLIQSVVTTQNNQDYARIIYNHFIARQALQLLENAGSVLRESDDPKQSILDLESSLASVGAEPERARTRSIADIVNSSLNKIEASMQSDGLSGLSTGFITLDKILGGMHPSDLVIVAGRPSMGKTALATSMAFNVSEAGNNVALFSLEMSSEQIIQRVQAQRSGVDSMSLREGSLTLDDFNTVFQASQSLASLPITIDDTPGITVNEIRTRCNRIKRREGSLDLVVIDYLQLCTASNTARRGGKTNEITEISKDLKGLAKDLDCPVIALSQLSRAVEQREDKRPKLSDLRESGSIEQDADCVCFVYRQEYYLERDEPEKGVSESEEKYTKRRNDWLTAKSYCANQAQVIVAKQRHGPIGTATLKFDKAHATFEDCR